jgi:hypothetical protein
MAIPADVQHAVFTKALPAKAVDAWSPPNASYADATASRLSLPDTQET